MDGFLGGAQKNMAPRQKKKNLGHPKNNEFNNKIIYLFWENSTSIPRVGVELTHISVRLGLSFPILQ